MVVFSVGHLFLKCEVIPIQFGKWVKYCGISYVFQIERLSVYTITWYGLCEEPIDNYSS